MFSLFMGRGSSRISALEDAYNTLNNIKKSKEIEVVKQSEFHELKTKERTTRETKEGKEDKFDWPPQRHGGVALELASRKQWADNDSDGRHVATVTRRPCPAGRGPSTRNTSSLAEHSSFRRIPQPPLGSPPSTTELSTPSPGSSSAEGGPAGWMTQNIARDNPPTAADKHPRAATCRPSLTNQ